jgi:hypothetical protein
VRCRDYQVENNPRDKPHRPQGYPRNADGHAGESTGSPAPVAAPPARTWLAGQLSICLV